MKGKGINKKKMAAEIIAAIFVLVAISYCLFSAKGIIFRSSESVRNTFWISYDTGSLVFNDGDGSKIGSDGSEAFTFEENSGTIKCLYSDSKIEWYTRFGSEELTSQDGRSIYYIYEK